MNKQRFIGFILVFVLIAQTLSGSVGISAATYNIVVAKDGSGNYTTVQAAINNVPSNSKSITTIYIKNGTYKEKINIPSSKTNVSLIGQSKAGTILTYDDSASKKTSDGSTLGTSKSASVTIAGAGFQAENISFENSYNESANGSSQAVAVLAQADKMIFKNCSFKGNQDTLYAGGKACRQYYYDCYMEGDVDFIFGAATAVFNNCEVFSVNRTGGCVTAPSTYSSDKGYLFYKCKLTTSCKPKSIYLGRPWIPSSNTGVTPKVLFRECELGSHITDAGWTVMSGNDPKNFEMWEYKNTGEGANSSRKQLPASKAADYTMEKFLAGSDGWNPIDSSVTPPVITDGVYVKSLVVNDSANAANWSVQSNLQVGDTTHGDRTFKFNQIPAEFLGAEWIRTACDSKMYTSQMASFTAKADISVYTGLDSRITNIPAWLNGWTNTGKSLSTDNSVTFNLYEKNFSSGTVVALGDNGAVSSSVNYVVIIKPYTAPAIMRGDLNGDKIINALDFGLLKKYLLDSSAGNINLSAADVNADGSVNAIDLAVLKSYLLGNKLSL